MADGAANLITVEVACATAERQQLVELTLPRGARLIDAVVASKVLDAWPDSRRRELTYGIWGQVNDADAELANGDRVEIYRPLRMDPREARRKLALEGQTMRGNAAD